MLAASFWLLTLFSCAFAAMFGGRDGRWFALMFFIGVALTWFADVMGDWHSTHYAVAVVDMLLFLGLFWLMLRSPSYWPIWAAASQLMTVLTHVVTLLLQQFPYRIYEGLSTVWVIPLMLFTIIGIEQDRKRTYDRLRPA